MAAFKSPNGQNGWTQLAILLGLTGAGFMIAGIIQIGFLNGMGISLTQMGNKKILMDALSNPKNIRTMQWMQFVSTLVLLFLPAIFFTIICYGKNLFWLGSNKYFSVLQIIFALAIIWVVNIYAQPLESVTESILKYFPKINALAKSMEDTYSDEVGAITNLSGPLSFLLGLFMIAILPAVFEEFFFRGALQTLLIKWWKKPAIAITVTSLLFSLVHSSIFLFLSRFALGYALGVIFYLSKNIWINIFAHFVNNSLALSVMYFGKKSAVEMSKRDLNVPVWSIVFSFAAFAVLIYLFINVSNKYLTPIAMQQNNLLNKETDLDYTV